MASLDECINQTVTCHFSFFSLKSKYSCDYSGLKKICSNTAPLDLNAIVL